MYTILVIESDKASQDNIAALLTAEGYQVVVAGNRTDAIKISESVLPDIIISNLAPLCYGEIELYKEIAELESFVGIPFIVISPRDDYGSIKQCLACGVDDYIVTPFENEDLFRRIAIRIEKSKVKLKEASKFLANTGGLITHELKTPLVSIQGFSEILASQASALLYDTIANIGRQINNSGRLLLRKIEKLLLLLHLRAVSAARTSGKTGEVVIVMNSFVREILKSLAAPGYNWQTVEIDCQTAEAHVQSEYLGILIAELTENAVIHSSGSCPVLLEGRLINKCYRITVVNKGDSSAVHEIKNLIGFHRMGMRDDSLSVKGLGIAIVAAICEIFGATIEINLTEESSIKINVDIPINISRLN